MSDAPERVTLSIDGTEVGAEAGSLLIAAAEEAGTYIPRFCWHPRMEPVGMCRMCLVEVEGPRGTMLTTSCTMAVAEGMVVSTVSPTVKKAQEGVLEFLLINHPLDCPVCDRGGECPLQDQTMSYGPGESRYVEEKRHYPKPLPISDLVLLDRERCILCARCTRFSDEIAGDSLIEFTERGNTTQVLTFPDDPFSSYFSGNTVQICPVGALTATPYRFRARPWDLEAAESTCTGCSVGCRISVHASRNQVVRYLGVDVDATNQGWLCDKGRFGFEALEGAGRLRSPMVRGDDGELREASWADAIDAAADGIKAAMEESGAAAVAGLGGARSTNEEAYAFGKFLRAIVGTPHLDAQLGDGPGPMLLAGITRRATIDDLERARTILVWGPDLKEELPVLHLRVRRSATRLGATLIVVHPRRTGLDPDADHIVRYRPGEGPDLLRRLAAGEGDLAAVSDALQAGPVVAIVGRTGLTELPTLADAVAGFAATLPDASVLPVDRRGNVHGALDMGVSPRLLPGRVAAADAGGRAALEDAWGSVAAGEGLDAAGILAAAGSGEVGALVLLGSDPVSDFSDSAAAGDALDRAFVVAIGLFADASTARSDVVFPALGAGEVEGTVTNLEGRVQKMSRLVSGPGGSRAAWEIIEDLARKVGTGLGVSSAEGLAKEIASVAPAYAGVEWDALAWGPGRDGIVVPSAEGSQPYIHESDTAESSPVDGFALHLGRVLYDGGTQLANSDSLSGLVAEPLAHLHPEDAERLGVAVGARVRVGSNGSAVTLSIAIDPSLAPGTVYVPFRPGLEIGASVAVKVEEV